MESKLSDLMKRMDHAVACDLPDCPDSAEAVGKDLKSLADWLVDPMRQVTTLEGWVPCSGSAGTDEWDAPATKAEHAAHVALGENRWFECGLCDDEADA